MNNLTNFPNLTSTTRPCNSIAKITLLVMMLASSPATTQLFNVVCWKSYQCVTDCNIWKSWVWPGMRLIIVTVNTSLLIKWAQFYTQKDLQTLWQTLKLFYVFMPIMLSSMIRIYYTISVPILHEFVNIVIRI